MEQKLRVVGIDMAKQVFPLVGMDEHGTIRLCRKFAFGTSGRI